MAEGSRQFDQNSFEYMQNHREPSPAEHIEHTEDKGDNHSAGGDSGSVASSRNRYGSFATKSTTSSMYNFAEFGASTEGEGRGHAIQGGRTEKRPSLLEKSMEGMIIGGARPGNEEFEHLDADENSDQETDNQTAGVTVSLENSDGITSTSTGVDEKSSEEASASALPAECSDQDIKTQEQTQVDVGYTENNAELV